MKMPRPQGGQEASLSTERLAWLFHDGPELIAGGYAVTFHGQPRATKDTDSFFKADRFHARAVIGAPMDELAVDDLADPKEFIRLGREPVAIDILPSIGGVEFDAAWDRRVESVIDLASGLKACFLCRDDLIASKIAAGRMRDLADVEEIRAAMESTLLERAGQEPPATNAGSPSE